MCAGGRGTKCKTAPHTAGQGTVQQPDANPSSMWLSPYLIGKDIVDRNSMAPPELPADAPVPDVLKPSVVDFLKPLGHNLDVAIPHSLHTFECRVKEEPVSACTDSTGNKQTNK